MNRQQLRLRVIDNIRRTDKDSVINFALDTALMKILAAERWTFSNKNVALSIVADDISITLPDDCGKVIDMTLVDAASTVYGMEERSLDQILKISSTVNTDSAGKPYYCGQENLVLHFYFEFILQIEN
jgi:hypothetical protein